MSNPLSKFERQKTTVPSPGYYSRAVAVQRGRGVGQSCRELCLRTHQSKPILCNEMWDQDLKLTLLSPISNAVKYITTLCAA